MIFMGVVGYFLGLGLLISSIACIISGNTMGSLVNIIFASGIVVLSTLGIKKTIRENNFNIEDVKEPLKCYISGSRIDSKYSFNAYFREKEFVLVIRQTYLIQPNAGEEIKIAYNNIERIVVNKKVVTFYLIDNNSSFPVASTTVMGGLIGGVEEFIKEKKGHYSKQPKILNFNYKYDVAYLIKKFEELNIKVEKDV